jgi:uncharacterized membrane protein
MTKKKKVYGPDAQDIRRAAYSMLANHGSNAAEIALRRARNLDAACEARGVWERIFATVSEMQQHGAGALA